MATVRYTTLNGEIVAEKRSGVRRLYQPDPLGSTVGLVDSTQAQTDSFSYWPYGQERARTGSTPTPFRYVGTAGYYRDAADRTYVRARVLGTAKGAWISKDPVGVGFESEGAYRYVSNRPVSVVDPSGLLGTLVRRRGDNPPCRLDPKKCGDEIQKGVQDCIKKFAPNQDKVFACIKKLFKGKPKDIAIDAACYLLACAQYDFKDPCANPDAKKIDTDCLLCAHFNLTKCLCLNAGLSMGVKCEPKYDKDVQACCLLPSLE
jgi:RHS repeat-associated protein